MKEIGTVRKYNGHLKIDVIELEGKKGNKVIREVVTKKSAVGAIIYNTETEKYIFVKQWRPGPKDFIIEIAAGLLDKEGEDPKECMIREIEEETGYKTDSIITLVDEFYSSPGFTDEKLTLYYAEVSEQVTTNLGVDDEEIEIVEMNYTELTYNIMKFTDAKTILALYKLIINKKNQ
jgi:ADP-ribose pyrophosphatase